MFMVIPMRCRSFRKTSFFEANPWRVVPLLQVCSSKRGDNYEASSSVFSLKLLLGFSQREVRCKLPEGIFP